jgi:hypothetical protein
MQAVTHAVQLYHEETELTEALARFAAEGLARGEGVVVIGTSTRWNALNARLRAGGGDPHAAVLRGQLRLFGARVILASCMSHGVPDRLAFDEALGGILGLVRMRYPSLRIFGELSDLLWSEGRREAATAIERFWNALAESQRASHPASPPASSQFSLLCACPLDSLDGRAYDGTLQSVCALHTHLLPAGDSDAFNAAVSGAIREVLEPQLVGMLHSLSSQHRPDTQMPSGQLVMLWLREHMPRTAEKVLARARARM